MGKFHKTQTLKKKNTPITMKKKEEVHAVRTLPACTPKAKKAAVGAADADDANAKKNLVDAVQERVTVAGECAHKLVDTVGKFLSEFSYKMIKEDKLDVVDALFRGSDEPSKTTSANFVNRLAPIFYRSRRSNTLEERWLHNGTKTEKEIFLFAKQNNFLFCLKLANGFSDLFKQSLSEVHSRWRTTCLRLLPRIRIALVKAAALSHDDHGSPASANIFLKAAFASANNTTAFKNDDVDTKAFSDLEMLFVSASKDKEEEEEDTIEVPVPEQHKSRFCWRGLARRSFGERKILFEKLRIFFEKNLPNDENQRQMLEKLFFSNISDVVDKAYETLPQSLLLKIVINLQKLILEPKFLKSIGYREKINEFKKFILKTKEEE